MKAFWNGFWISATLLVCATAAADAPPYIPMQGFLTDLDDQPLSGEHDFVFSLYPSDTADTPFYRETQTLPVDAGHFTAYLGDVEPLDLGMFAEHEIVFVGIRIDDDQEIEPRMQLATAPFAAFAQACGDAETLGGMASSDFAAADHAHDYSSLANVPASFPPSTHGHAWGDLSEVPAGLNDGDDVRTQSEVEGWARNACFDTRTELTDELDGVYASAGHNHDSRYVQSISAGTGIDTSCSSGNCSISVDATDFNAVPSHSGGLGSSVSLSSSWTTLASTTLEVPVPGTVVAIGTASISGGLVPGVVQGRVGITTGLNSAPAEHAVMHVGEVVVNSTTVSAVFDQPSAGTVTLYINAASTGSNISAGGQLSAFFIPTR